MLSAVHVMGMKTARQHLRNPPRIEKTSFLGLERNRVRRFLLSLMGTHSSLSFRILMQYRAPLVGAPIRIEISIFHSQLRVLLEPTSQTSHFSFPLYPIILRSLAYYPNSLQLYF